MYLVPGPLITGITLFILTVNPLEYGLNEDQLPPKGYTVLFFDFYFHMINWGFAGIELHVLLQ